MKRNTKITKPGMRIAINGSALFRLPATGEKFAGFMKWGNARINIKQTRRLNMAENLPVIQQKAMTLRDYLQGDKIRGALSQALPKWLSVDRLLRIVFTSTMKNPKLLDCTRESLLQSIMQCAQLGLEPILGRAYLIPYNNSKKVGDRWEKVLECQFQPGYQGLVDLARRSGIIKDVFAKVVYENDEFDIEYGTNRKLMHKPCLSGEPGEPIGAYTVWEYADGLKAFEFMPAHEIYKRRDKSQAYKYAMDNPKDKSAQDCPWIQWPEEQMCKTVVKHMAKLQPASIDFMEAVEMDNDTENYKRLSAGKDALLIPPEPPNTELFDELVKGKTADPGFDPAKLAEFIKTSADIMGKTELDVKVLATAPGEFEDFWTQFEKWSANKPEPQKEAAPEDLKTEGKKKGKDKLELKGETITHVNCPECIDEPVNVKACLSCVERENCKVRPGAKA
jgi:recombination protein RecT